MKILSFSDVHLLESPVEQLQSIIQSEKIDIVILLGGLFPEASTNEVSGKKLQTKKKKTQERQNSNILELNWLLIPILVIPDEKDLKNNYLIRQMQGQEAVWIRYIHNKGTIIDSWFIFSIIESQNDDQESLMKNIEEYSKIAPDKSILLYIGKKRLNFPNVHSIFLTNGSKIPNTNSFVVTIDSIGEGAVTIIDLEKKTVNSMLVQ